MVVLTYLYDNILTDLHDELYNRLLCTDDSLVVEYGI
jgi:hypothetical protein